VAKKKVLQSAMYTAECQNEALKGLEMVKRATLETSEEDVDKTTLETSVNRFP
jgi:hypothetical protein